MVYQQMSITHSSIKCTVVVLVQTQLVFQQDVKVIIHKNVNSVKKTTENVWFLVNKKFKFN